MKTSKIKYNEKQVDVVINKLELTLVSYVLWQFDEVSHHDHQVKKNYYVQPLLHMLLWWTRIQWQTKKSKWYIYS